MMLRFLFWLLSLPFAAAALVFALTNRGNVTISFWPFDVTVALPLSILVLGLLILGVGMGLSLGFVNSLARRIEIRHLRKALLKLQEDTKIIPPAASCVISSAKPVWPERPASSGGLGGGLGERSGLARLSPFSRQTLFSFRKPTL